MTRPLPIDAEKKVLMRSMLENEVILIQSDTGSGKTTRIPIWALQELETLYGRRQNSRVYCTQPRVAAAIQVADYVRKQLGHSPNNLYVGHHHRHGKGYDTTRLLYLTEGMLLRYMQSQQLLEDVAVLVLDEVHERTANMEAILGLLKDRVIPGRKGSLRVIIMSATMDPAEYQQHFRIKPEQTHFVEGRCFEVPVRYVDRGVRSYVTASLDIVDEIVRKKEAGDILVFLPGQEDCDSMVTQLNRMPPTHNSQAGESSSRDRPSSAADEIIALPFYRALPWDEQQKVFRHYPRQRKVVCATNVAETSHTIVGIVHIIDSCYQKIPHHSPSTGAEELVKTPYSKAQGEQRRGRAGRTQPGKCYRLMKESSYKELDDLSTPAVLTEDITGFFLRLLMHGVNPYKFSFISRPSNANMDYAITHLYFLGAVEWKPESGAIGLSSIGEAMSQLSLDPRMARALIESVKLGCVGDMLIIASLFGEEHRVFRRPQDSGKAEKAKKAQAKFHDNQGDFFSYLKVGRNWRRAVAMDRWNEEQARLHRTAPRNNGRKATEQFCYASWLSDRYLKGADQNYDQLRETLIALANPHAATNIVDRNPDEPVDYHSLKKALISGFLTNIAGFDQDVKTYKLRLLPSGGDSSQGSSSSKPMEIDERSIMAFTGEIGKNNPLAKERQNNVLFGHLTDGAWKNGVKCLAMKTCTTLDDLMGIMLPPPHIPLEWTD